LGELILGLEARDADCGQ